MSETLCTQSVNRGDSRWSNFQPCGRKAVQDGLCSLHLKVRERRAAKIAEWDAKRDAGARLLAEAKRLSEVLGVHVSANYSWAGQGGYTGDFVVPADWLRRIAKGYEA